MFCIRDFAQERIRHGTAAELVAVDRDTVRHTRVACQDTVSEPELDRFVCVHPRFCVHEVRELSAGHARLQVE